MCSTHLSECLNLLNFKRMYTAFVGAGGGCPPTLPLPESYCFKFRSSLLAFISGTEVVSLFILNNAHLRLFIADVVSACSALQLLSNFSLKGLAIKHM